MNGDGSALARLFLCPLALGIVLLGIAARADDPRSGAGQPEFRRLEVDAATPEDWPRGEWIPIDAAHFEKFEFAGGDAEPGPLGAYLDRVTYSARLDEHDVLTGSGSAHFRSRSHSELASIGMPSFAISSITQGGRPMLFGCDADSMIQVVVGEDDTVMDFAWSQRGRRHDSVTSFEMNWLTTTSARVDLTLPANRRLEIDNELISATHGAPDGQIVYEIEIGAARKSILRLIDVSEEKAPPVIDCELSQTASASATRLVIQSNLALDAQLTGPFEAQIPVPPEFSVLRATLPGGDRLPIHRDASGVVRIRFPQLSAGRHTLFRIVAQRAVDWDAPVVVPRLSPLNATLLKEAWTIEAEKPLEIVSVDAPGYLQTGLSAEEQRELWSFEALSGAGPFRVQARASEGLLDASPISRLRQTASRLESRTLVELAAKSDPVFDVDLDIAAPWVVLSADVAGANGALRPAMWEVVRTDESSHRLRLHLPVAVRPGQRLPVLVTAAAQFPLNGVSITSTPVHPVVGGAVSPQRLVMDHLDVPREGLSNWAVVPAAEVPETTLSLLGFTAAEQARVKVWTPAGRAGEPLQSTPDASAEPIESDLRSAPSDTEAEPGATTAMIGCELVGSDLHANVTFRFSHPIDISGWVIALNGPWQLIESLSDGRPIVSAASPEELRLPEGLPASRQLTIRYRVAAETSGLTAVQHILLPQLPIDVSNWTGQIEAGSDVRILDAKNAAAISVVEVEASRLSSWLGPLGRGRGESRFHPLEADSWKALAGISLDPEPFRSNSGVKLAGFQWPEELIFRTCAQPRLTWACWSMVVGGLLFGLALRRLEWRLVFAVFVLGIGSAVIGPVLGQPWQQTAGSLAIGLLISAFVPRIWFAPSAVSVRKPSLSSYVLATTVLISCSLSSIVGKPASAADEPDVDVLIPLTDGVPGETVLVRKSVAEHFQAWLARERPRPWLVGRSQSTVTIDSRGDESIVMELQVLSASDAATVVPLRLDGMTLRGSDAVQLNGQPVRITPLADGLGFAVTVPSNPKTGDAGYQTSSLSIRGQLRPSRNETWTRSAMSVPAAAIAELTIDSHTAAIGEVAARGEVRRSASTHVESQLGSVTSWSFDLASEALVQGNAEPGGRAQSLVTVQPRAIRILSRLTLDDGESASDSAEPIDVDFMLPGDAVVESVSGTTLDSYQLLKEHGQTRLWVELHRSPLSRPEIDVQYVLSATGDLNVTIPELPFFSKGRLSSHQIGFASDQAFELEVVSDMGPESLVWDLAPSEAAFSLRRDRNLPAPVAAIELESPTPVSIQLRERRLSRVVEADQSLSPDGEGLRWDATLRIETTGRAAMFHTLQLDPAIAITSVGVRQNDVDRLIRTVAKGSTLTLLLRDDRPGAQLVTLSGRWTAPPGTWHLLPQLTVDNAEMRRSDLTLNATSARPLEWRKASDDLTPVSLTSADRVTISAATAGQEFRWRLPPERASVTEFDSLRRTTGGAVLSTTWRIDGETPGEISVELRRPDLLEDVTGDFELPAKPQGVNPAPMLLRRSNEKSPAWLTITQRLGDFDSSTVIGPKLVGPTISESDRWLLVASDLRLDIEPGGAQAVPAPAEAPESWKAAVASGASVYRSGKWRLRRENPANSGPGGAARIETTVIIDADRILGRSQLFLLPYRSGRVEITLPAGTIMNDGRNRDLELAPNGTLNLTTRERRPMEMEIAWSAPTLEKDQLEWTPGHLGISGYEIDEQIVVSAPGRAVYGTIGKQGGARAREQLLRGREAFLERAAENYAEREDRPRWLTAELQRTQEEIGTPRDRRNPGQADATAFDSELSALTAGDRFAWVLGSPSGAPLWVVSRRLVAIVAMTAVLIALSLIGPVIVRLSVRWRLADGSGIRSALPLAALSAIWWAFFTPSVIGFLLLVASLGWLLGMRFGLFRGGRLPRVG